MPSVRARIGEYVRTEAGFRRSGTLTFGTLAAVAQLWQFGAYGGFAWWLFLVALAYAGGWMWSFFMWQAMKGNIERIKLRIEAARRASADSANDESHST